MRNEEKLVKLREMGNRVTESPDHWIGGYPDGDNAEVYCRTCCEKNIKHLMNGFHPPLPVQKEEALLPLSDEDKEEIHFTPPFVDGGWSSEYDGLPMCASCSAPLTGTLTDEGIANEIAHYLKCEDNGVVISSERNAWDLITLISNAGSQYSNDIGKILEKVSFQ
jgi:hypothetical protein